MEEWTAKTEAFENTDCTAHVKMIVVVFQQTYQVFFDTWTGTRHNDSIVDMDCLMHFSAKKNIF